MDKPGFCKRSVCRLIRDNFLQYLGIAAPVCQNIDKIENHGHKRRCEIGLNVAGCGFCFLTVEYLDIFRFRFEVDLEPFYLIEQELLFETVFLLIILLPFFSIESRIPGKRMQF